MINQEIFKKISKTEKQELFEQLTDRHLEITVKGDEDQYYCLVAKELIHGSRIECIASAGFVIPRIHQDVIISIEVGEHRYYANTRLLVEDMQKCSLDLSGPIFQLQRRRSVRLTLPREMPQSANIISLHGTTVFIPAIIDNFSAGGVRLKVENTEHTLLVGLELEIVMQLSKKSPMQFIAQIRHLSESFQEEKRVQMIGVQFLGLDKNMETRLMISLMDLQREVFLKYSSS